ncbi:MAG: DUF3791 domain-containing protein [Christensenellales bacterium]|jgi:hypothetical protein
MRQTLQFKVFCIEQYKNEHNLTGSEAVKKFKEFGVFDYLESFFDVLHSLGAKYIVSDIDMFIAARQRDGIE